VDERVEAGRRRGLRGAGRRRVRIRTRRGVTRISFRRRSPDEFTGRRARTACDFRRRGFDRLPAVHAGCPHFGPLEKADAGLSSLARGVVGSEILKIGAEVRALKAKGIQVCNLTVGDFDPAQFPSPPNCRKGRARRSSTGRRTTRPPHGLMPLREAIVRFYARELSLDYPVESVLVASGARPLLYAAYRTLLDPGDVAVYSVPSWNNNHYVWLSGARAVEIPRPRGHELLPDAAQLASHLHVARALVVNSPLNPTGTVIAAGALAEIAALVVEENRRRDAAGRRPLFLVFDQVYWMLTFHGAAHVTPVGLVPGVAPYTILLDAISKSFCATGLRVGWALMPPALRGRMADLLGHVGAWAPRASRRPRRSCSTRRSATGRGRRR